MSEAVAPSRAMRSRANRRESSVARGIELDSPSLKLTDLVGLYHVERPRETLCRNFARNFVSRDSSPPRPPTDPDLRGAGVGNHPGLPGPRPLLPLGIETTLHLRLFPRKSRPIPPRMGTHLHSGLGWFW